MQTSNTPLDRERLPCLDGWRAISISLVLIQHSFAHPGWPEALAFSPLGAIGGVGVRFFFVISGFLITWLMLKELRSRGQVCLRSFYLRRALRILPIYIVYVFSVFLLQMFGSLSIPVDQWLRSLTFTVNFGGVRPPLGHLWTLSVEEQFYLIWPFIVAAFCGLDPRRLLFVLAIPLLGCPMLRAIAQQVEITHPVATLVLKWHSFFTICDGLAYGCLGAIIFFHKPSIIIDSLATRPFTTLAVGATAIVLPLSFWIFPMLKSLQPLQDTLQCGGFLVLMLLSIVLPRWLPFRPLEWKPVAAIGMLSYSLYMWHGLFDIKPSYWPWPMDFLHGFPQWLIPVFIAATISYHLIEQPALHQKNRLLVRFKLLSQKI